MMASKKSLLASGVALLASAALLAGTTFAWFTDSVVNTGNKIQAGNLAIGAYAYDLAEDGEGGFEIEGVNGGNPFKFETEGQNLKTDETPIISEELFEPGKSNAKLLKVENEGTLAAKIKLDFTVEDGGLMEALWFDFVKVENGEVKGSFTRRPMNTLETFAENLELPLLEKGDNVQFILIYGMDENAGNAFKDKSFTADVAILATQYTKEEDGFGNDQYDKGAEWPISDAAALEEAVAAAKPGDTLVVESGVYSLSEGLTIPEGVSLVGAQAGRPAAEWADDAGAEKTILKVEAPADGQRVLVLSDQASVDGIFIDCTGCSKGIYANGAQVEIRNCAIFDSANDGIDIDNGVTPVVEGCYIKGLEDCGIELEGYSGEGRVVGNVVADVANSVNGGIKVGPGSGNILVSGNTVRNLHSGVQSGSSSVKGSAIHVYDTRGGTVTVENNVVENADQGIAVYKYRSAADGDKAIVRGNTVSGYTIFGIVAYNLNENGTHETVVELAGNTLTGTAATGWGDIFVNDGGTAPWRVEIQNGNVVNGVLATPNTVVKE